jgi:Centromere DNA-binding protein complex CBF3 subunit, domain 2
MRDYNAAMRHKDVLLCTMGALAQYLFWRWHIVGEEPPDFSSHQAWYELKILVGADRFKPLSYETQADCCAAALAEAGIIANLVTHVCRGSSARLAELLGVLESEVSALNLLYYVTCTLLTTISIYRFLRQRTGRKAQRKRSTCRASLSPLCVGLLAFSMLLVATSFRGQE